MSIHRIQKNKNYSMMSNIPLRDARLSFGARGMLAFLLSQPDDWEVSTAHLIKSSPAGKTAVYSMINELVDLGYMTKVEYKGDGSKFAGVAYDVHEESFKPVDQQPVVKTREKMESLIPEDFQPTEVSLNWAKEKGVVNMPVLKEVTEQFVEHYLAKGIERKDWQASWRTWIRNSLDVTSWAYRASLTSDPTIYDGGL